MSVPLPKLNVLNRNDFVQVCGPFFEHSPWIAERTWDCRPFSSRDALHASLCDTVKQASTDEQIRLIASHPDLVGRLAREGKLTRESMTEQAVAGLTALTDAEIGQFESYNADYHAKFGFPFCDLRAENKKEAILAAFPIRVANSREEEVRIALEEIFKIARLRLMDAISED